MKNSDNFYWKNTNLFKKHHDYLQGFFWQSNKNLSKILNNYHRTNLSTKSWSIMLYPWLYYYQSARKRGGCHGHDPAILGRYRHLHHAGLHFPRGRRADDQFPPAQIDPDDAGERADRARADAGCLRPRHRERLSLLFLR